MSVTVWHLGGGGGHCDGGHSGSNGDGDSNSSRDGNTKGCMANVGQSMTGRGYAGTLNNTGASVTDEQFAYRAVRQGEWGMCLAHWKVWRKGREPGQQWPMHLYYLPLALSGLLSQVEYADANMRAGKPSSVEAHKRGASAAQLRALDFAMAKGASSIKSAGRIFF